MCKEPGHSTQRVYVRFDKEPQAKSDIPFLTFQMTCIQGHTHTYHRHEVIAEVGLEPVGGAVLGGLLFFVDPVVGVIGAVAGYAAVLRAEEEKVRRFNASVG